MPPMLVALGLLVLVGQSTAIRLTREENGAMLDMALADPETSFHAWAARHNKPYAALPLATIVMASAGGGKTTLMDLPPAQQLLLHQFHDRKQVWLDNARFAAEYNLKHAASGHWLGLNGLADMAFDDYRKMLGTRIAPKSGGGDLQQGSSVRSSGREPGFMYEGVELASLPPSLDWRNSSAVTHVKNQGMCGSCWAFATTGAIEGINALYTHKLAPLSEQELVDCDRDVDMGCEGGMMDNAYEWIIKSGGVHMEEDWPYTAMEDPEGCSLVKHRNERVVTIDGYQDVPVGDEAALLKAVAHQPVAVAIEADSRAFQLYVGGVMADPGCGSELNHGVLLVGYGGLDHGRIPRPAHAADPANGPYWIIKNSWGAAWGAEGYIKIQMGYRDNITGTQGLCGVTLAASFPIKRNPNPPAPKPGPPGPEPAPPQPGPAGPVMCDNSHACPPESTCCCLDSPSSASGSRGVGGPCALWGCCPMVAATCCEDHLHCCPKELPVCDVDQGRCAAKGSPFSISWTNKLPAQKVDPGHTTATTASQASATPRSVVIKQRRDHVAAQQL